ncbi:MAG: hypothetical protein J6U49_04345 [Alistipes sp.]|nr:hypothetical protein [Alistipes sp.]
MRKIVEFGKIGMSIVVLDMNFMSKIKNIKQYLKDKIIFRRKFSCKKFAIYDSFSLKKPLLLAKNQLSLPHAPAGSKVRTICRGVEPGA